MKYFHIVYALNNNYLLSIRKVKAFFKLRRSVVETGYNIFRID